QKRPGVHLCIDAPVLRIENDRVHLKDQMIEAGTIILAAGITRTHVVAEIPLQKGRHGQIAVDATMRSADHPAVWALGDSASIPCPDGMHYPYLAQHAMREGKQLAKNIHAVINGRQPQPFIYDTKGIMGALGHHTGFGSVFGLRLHGFLAWWVRRTYYLLVMP